MTTSPISLRSVRRPPVLKGEPLIGQLRLAVTNPHQLMMNGYRELGPAFRFRVLNREYSVIAGVEANRFVAGDGKDLLCSRGLMGTASEKMGCPNMILGTDGEAHLVQRNTIKPLLNPALFYDRIDMLAGCANDIVSEALRRREIAVGSTLRQLVSNQIGYSLQGYKTSYEEVQSLIHYFGGYMNIYAMRKWPELMLKTPAFAKAIHVTKQHAKKMLGMAEQRGRAGEQVPPLYLDAVLRAMDESGFPFTQGDREIHAVLPFVLALDTVASTLAFMLERVINEPQWLDLLQPEVDAIFAGGTPSADALRADSALMGFARETLRMQPAAPAIPRVAVSDFEFAGFRFREDEQVIVFTTSDHFNADYFPDPYRFDIERYRNGRKEHRQSVYAPFGKGSHACLGAGLTELLLPLNFGTLLHRCDIRAACDMRKVKVHFNPGRALTDNFRVRVAARV